VPDRVKPSFVIFDIRALWRCNHIVTVGIKGLRQVPLSACLTKVVILSLSFIVTFGYQCNSWASRFLYI